MTPSFCAGIATGIPKRAMNSRFEGLILITLAVVMVTVRVQASALIAACGLVCLVARIQHVSAHAGQFTMCLPFAQAMAAAPSKG